jgi:glycosyltransferase involved in cell wall biosynthesis
VRSAIALLGRIDSPTDGIWDYCTFLAQALRENGIEFAPVRVRWFEDGWLAALRELSRQAIGWRDRWVLVQYTALSWSRYGFPLGVLAAVAILRHRGARVAIVFHDTLPFGGSRVSDRIRNWIQISVMRRLTRDSQRAVSVLPIARMSWAQSDSLQQKFVTIPIGANIPEMQERAGRRPAGGLASSLVIFGVTVRHREVIQAEVSDIAYAVRRAAQAASPIQLIVLGRGSFEAEEFLKKSLEGVNVCVSALGILPAERVTDILSASDAMLFVRGYISGRRGSAIAGIACGLPVVAYSGPETCFPVTEAGVDLSPEGDREALAAALTRVMTESDYREELRKRSERAQAEYFAWSKIARQFAVSVITP